LLFGSLYHYVDFIVVCQSVSLRRFDCCLAVCITHSTIQLVYIFQRHSLTVTMVKYMSSAS